METYFDKQAHQKKVMMRQSSFLGDLQSLNSLKGNVSFKSLERVRNQSLDKLPTSFESATMQFIRNDNLMHIKKPHAYNLKHHEKFDLSNPDRKISKGEKYNMINKALHKDPSNVVSDKSYQQILKYSELLLINDDEFIAARRQLFNKYEGNVTTQTHVFNRLAQNKKSVDADKSVDTGSALLRNPSMQSGYVRKSSSNSSPLLLKSQR